MEDHIFEGYKAAIDSEIDADPDNHAGIAMGFGLAGEFLKRNLLKTIKFTMLFDWESKTYRDRHIYLDPYMGDFEYVFGSSS